MITVSLRIAKESVFTGTSLINALWEGDETVGQIIIKVLR